jgi:hypothetical protein
MSRRTLLLICVLILFVAAYALAWFVRSLDREDWGLRRGSSSAAEAQKSGSYVGVYSPAARSVALENSSIEIPDAWVERCWTPHLNLWLRETKKLANGYFLYIPIRRNETINSQNKYKVFLRLTEESARYSSLSGIGYEPDSPNHGFVVYLDSLPKTLRFVITLKEQSGAIGATAPEALQFNRTF